MVNSEGFSAQRTEFRILSVVKLNQFLHGLFYVTLIHDVVALKERPSEILAHTIAGEVHLRLL